MSFQSSDLKLSTHKYVIAYVQACRNLWNIRLFHMIPINNWATIYNQPTHLSAKFKNPFNLLIRT